MNNKKYNPFADMYNFNANSSNWVQRLGHNADFYNNPLGYNSSPTPRPYDNTTASAPDDDNEVVSGFRPQTPRTTSLNNSFNVNKQQLSMGNMSSFNLKGNNNASDFNANSNNWVQRLGHNADFYNNPLGYNSSPTPRPYKIASNGTLSNLFNQSNSVANNNPTITFEDVYWGDGKIKSMYEIEGGYSDRINDSGGPTNYGVTKDALNEYLHLWHSPIKKGGFFPTKIEDLTAEQARQIMDEMYYQRYNIDKIQNLLLARNTFDAEVNQGTDAGKMLANAMNEFYGYVPNQSDNFFYRNIQINNTLANAVNNLTPEETIKVNDILTRLRMDKYFQSTDENPIKNVNNLNGWYNRTKSYYSNPQEFEKLYKSRVDDYIKNKYHQHYNGK